MRRPVPRRGPVSAGVRRRPGPGPTAGPDV